MILYISAYFILVFKSYFHTCMKYILSFLLIVCYHSIIAQPYVIVLGTAQDGGYPHIGCKKTCCTNAWANDSAKRLVVSLAVVDPATKQWWLFEATPDINEQLHLFNQLTHNEYRYLPNGIFLTHAHIGHYTGLMELGREAMGAKAVPVYTLPKMKEFLEQNGPWGQLVKLNNISLNELATAQQLTLTNNIKIETYTVPHRDEYSETAGFKIITSKKKYLFIPDINKWQQWDKDLKQELSDVDIAFVDATFYDSTELPGRRMDEVPHPFVVETAQLLDDCQTATKAKVHFIHFNHTNKLLWDNKSRSAFIKQYGFRLAEQGAKY